MPVHASHKGTRRCGARGSAAILLASGIIAAGLFGWSAAAQSPGTIPQPPPPAVTPDPQKAKAAYQEGVRAEKARDWDSAYTDYTDAIGLAPDVREYQLRREVVKGRLVQAKADTAERFAISGKLDAAQKELLSALYIDPGNSTLRERLNQLIADDPSRSRVTTTADLSGVPDLAYRQGRRSFDFRGTTQAAYQEVARQFGVEVAFDVDLRSRQVRFRVDDVDFRTAVRLLGSQTATFWRPLSARLFFVTDDTPQKRRDYEASVVRTILLPASETPEQMTETLRMVREITGITRSQLDTNARTITLRASPQAIAVATDLLNDIEQPSGELIIEAEVLQVDRTFAQQLGITPPQKAQVFTVSSQQIQEAQQSAAGLVDVITQIFGSTVVPPLVAFGGGQTTFLATLPGASADFARMLSLVQQGRRILLRAKDGQPASFFVGERFPVSLTSFSASFGANSTTSGAANTNPLTNYAVGNTPTAVALGSLRNNGTNDMIVANAADNTVSVLLGNGDGTFAAQTTFATGTDPVWVATGSFNASNDANLDVVVANKGANTISILLGNGDGTFQPKADIATGNTPVAVIANDFHDKTSSSFTDLAVVNQADSSIGLYEGNGDGTFQPPTLLQLPAGFKPAAITATDLNADGHLDLLVADQGNNSVSVFLGNGDGTFQNRTDYAVGDAPIGVVTGDFNADGVIDFVSANGAGNSISLYLGQKNNQGTATGTFAVGLQRDFAAGTTPTGIVAGDINLDGLPDVVVTDQGDNAVSIILNAGSGLFNTNAEIPVDSAPLGIASTDLNGDGRPDAVVANSGSANATVILNSTSLFGSGSGLPGSLFPGVQYLDIGMKMKATPRIHPDGDVTLDMNLELSSLSGSSLNSIPVVSNQSIEQTVRLKENETGVLAGFLQTQLSNAITGTPGAGEIPAVGYLASDQNAQREESEVLILVTPRLVRLAPRRDHVIYAGPGSLDNGAPAAAPGFGGQLGLQRNPGAQAAPPVAAPNPAQPGEIPPNPPQGQQPPPPVQTVAPPPDQQGAPAQQQAPPPPVDTPPQPQ